MIQISSKKFDDVWFSLVLNGAGRLVACSFSDLSQRAAERAVRRKLGYEEVEVGNAPQNVRLFRKIRRIYLGEPSAVNLKALDLSQVSEFQRKVCMQLLRISRGRVTTYGAIAKKLGGRRFARAVGGAVASNPLSLVVPCHRVVPASLKVGNYGTPGRKPSQGGYMKRRILEREGVKFIGDRISSESIWKP